MKKKLFIKRGFRNIRKRIKELTLTIKGKIRDLCRKEEHLLFYFVILLLGIGAIVLGLRIDDQSGIYIGLGTGIITSLIVSIIINIANARREKRRISADKEIVFKSLLNNSIIVYTDKIRDINTYLAYCCPEIPSIYKLYEDFSGYEVFQKFLEQLDFKNVTEENKQRLNQLFNFQHSEISALASNLHSLPTLNYYLMNLLTEEELEKIVTEQEKDEYFHNINTMFKYYDKRILNYQQCVEVLRETMYVTSNIISLFDSGKKEVAPIEYDIKQYIDVLDTRSEKEQAEADLKKVEEEERYWAEHPDKYQAYIKEMEELSNRTEEDRILDEADRYINGISFGRVVIPKLEQLDPQSDKVKVFFARDDVQNSLKKERAKRKLVEKHFGKEYLKKLKREKDH